MQGPSRQEEPTSVMHRLRESPASRTAPLLIGLLGLWLFQTSPAPGLGLAVLVFAAATGVGLAIDALIDARERKTPPQHDGEEY